MSITITSSMNMEQIEAVLRQLELQVKAKKRGVNTLKYCGKINFKKDGLNLQKEWRNEWR